jgi:hypothetical protein
MKRTPPSSRRLPRLVRFVRFTLLALASLSLFDNPTHAADAPQFEQEILPILYHHCFSCHSEKQAKPKGGLRLDSLRGIRKGQVLEPGKPDESELLSRTLLPTDHEDVMPPLKGGAQPLSETERQLLRRWIAAGADFGTWTRFDHRGTAFQPQSPIPSPRDLTARIDALVEAHHTQNGSALLPPANDETFLRRVFLDVIGRIPTLEESTRFLEDRSPEKRAKLIDALLASPGFESHFFNWKADQLRVYRIDGLPGWLYGDWLKETIRSKQPYDVTVRQLVTAQGYLWDNGAVGFFLRDLGMPLDHMSNLSRLFLGTRMECAQCHDHPLQPVTQKDFYQMAAFTFGVSNLASTSGYSTSYIPQWPELTRKLDAMHADSGLRQSVSKTVSFLKRLTTDTGKPLRFPETYGSDPSLRQVPVQPETLFGDPIGNFTDSPREAFAQWLTSPRNPRFAKAIANRLWKFVMGRGLIEPVDSLSALPEPHHQPLIQAITDAMIGLRYDERAFLGALLNSRLYQCESLRETPPPGLPCDLRGPLLRRLSAEQIWDSCLTLIVPDLDQRTFHRKTEGSYLDPKRLRQLVSMSPDELIARAKDERAYHDRHRQSQLRRLEQKQELDAALARKDSAAIASLKAAHARENAASVDPLMQPLSMGPVQQAPESDPRWIQLPTNLVRASEIPVPLPADHFLRQFGKSDRREIDAFNRDPNTTHALALMNGELTERILLQCKQLESKPPAVPPRSEDLVQRIYRAVLVRSATPEELQILSQFSAGIAPSSEDLLWALLNSPEFLFQR